MVGHAQRIGYFDLFAGPGRYETGEKSVPLLILEKAVASEKIRSRLVSLFNDAEPDHTSTLEDEIGQIPGIEKLAFKPRVSTSEVNDDLAAYFEGTNTIPAVTFIDPWGYKGLSQRLIKAVIKDFGCEVVFFFNYNRINMGIDNPKVQGHMEALFGEVGLRELVAECEGADPDAREAAIGRHLEEGLRTLGAEHLVSFRFIRIDGRTSHFICFVSKHPLGYQIMKEIMAGKGLVDQDGVPMYDYVSSAGGKQALLDRPRPYVQLPEDLLATFPKETTTMKEVYERHNIGKPFVKKNYKRVLIEMESRGDIECNPPAGDRRSGTIADTTMITFP
jgi:three-Cys-motif partner protein